jgi:hypothetical protein
MGVVMGGLVEFVTMSTWTFVLIGMAFLTLIAFDIWIVIIVVRGFTRLIRAERARMEIENRERRRIRRMIQRRASDEDWMRFLAGLEDEGNN